MSYSGATTCQTCSSVNNSPGTTPPGATSQSQCVASPSGTYTNSSNCAVQCSTGTYSSSAGSSSCSSCSASQVAPAGATASSQCTTCATGFAPNTAKSACTATLTAIHRKKRAILPCQPGFALCPVLSGRRGVKECVDISSDVESVEAVWAKALARNAPHSILERQQTTSAVHVITNAPRATT